MYQSQPGHDSFQPVNVNVKKAFFIHDCERPLLLALLLLSSKPFKKGVNRYLFELMFFNQSFESVFFGIDENAVKLSKSTL